MPGLRFRLLFAAAFVLSFGLVTGNATAAETDPEGRLYEPSVDPVADVRQAIERADDGDRKALVVLGANWCHDSRALASRLHQSPLSDVIQQNYELVFVDVGYLDKGGDVLDQVGVAQFYATPTVLIVDPSNGQVVNDQDRHVWGNAYNIDMASSVRYFETWAMSERHADPAMESAELRKLYAQINQFEQQQAERVAAGYALVGPLLKSYKAGVPAEEFRARWNELRDFRSTIPDDIQRLRDEARRRVSDGDRDIELEFPEYPPLSWETE